MKIFLAKMRLCPKRFMTIIIMEVLGLRIHNEVIKGQQIKGALL